MKTKIYVACHKKFIKPFPYNFFLKYIEVGRYYNSKKIFKLNDNSGDSISFKNPSYNELTAIYWIWKNDFNSKIVGICHYRRYFAELSKKKHKFLLLNPKKIHKLLKSYDMIVRKRNIFDISCRERISTNQCALRSEDIPIIKNIILDIHGHDHADAFDKILDRNYNFLCNMLISRKELFDEYCEWLFPILEELEKKIDENKLIGQEKRIFGLWAEYLLNTYIYANNLKFIECETPCIEKDISDFANLKIRVKNKIVRLLSR